VKEARENGYKVAEMIFKKKLEKKEGEDFLMSPTHPKSNQEYTNELVEKSYTTVLR
jgi:hypothetical protein